ncbi:MAG: M1 family metallopeptidase [Candidatus Bipolaricaulia bacterium]
MRSAKPLLVVLFLGLALVSWAGPDSGPDSFPHYQLWLGVSFGEAGPQFTGHERLEYLNAEGQALNELYLRLYPNGGLTYGAGGLALGSVTVNGTQVEPLIESGGTVVQIPLEEPLPPGANLVLELDFVGLVPQNFASSNGSSYGIYDYSGGMLKLANWFPILAAYDEAGWHLDPFYNWGDAVYSETADFEVWITAPAEQVVVASGIELEQVLNPDGTVTYHYSAELMRDFFVAMSPHLKRLTAQVGTTRVNSYYFEGDELGGQKALEVGANALFLFNQRFGLYPFPELDILETTLPWAGGVEYPGIVLISDKLYGSAGYMAERELEFAMIVSHEVSHQWWYSLVGNDVIREPWLDEALATYSSGIYAQELLGEAAYQGLLREWEYNYRRARGSVSVPITAPLDQFYSNSIYYGIVYCGGALFYDELRATLGDGPFFASLQEYFRRFEYRVATTSELLALFEEVSGQELDKLYARWLSAPVTTAGRGGGELAGAASVPGQPASLPLSH